MLPHLSFVAEFSKAVSVLIVLVLLGLMMAYLSRVSVFPDLIPGNSSSVTWVQQPQVSPQRMLLTPNPFQLQVEQGPTSTPDTATGMVIPVSVCSNVSCLFMCWWGVDLRYLHTLLNWPWPAFRRAVLSADHRGNPDACILTEQPKCIEGKQYLELKVPQELQDGSFLGAPPRLRCPLVVTLLIAGDHEDESVESPTRVVALVSTIHIKDALVPMATGVLSQFLKLSSGQLTTLQPLYVSGVSNQFQEDNESTLEDRPQNDICCVVCHCNPASLALLPCRHACICSYCLPKLSNCPLCRTHIHSYFHVIQSALPPDQVSTSNRSGQVGDDGSETAARLRQATISS